MGDLKASAGQVRLTTGDLKASVGQVRSTTIADLKASVGSGLLSNQPQIIYSIKKTIKYINASQSYKLSQGRPNSESKDSNFIH